MPRPSTSSRYSGLVVPLFSLRGRHDLGVGEILDLLPLIRWASDFGQRVLQLLPISETCPGEASPYNALSAFAIDPVYISVHAVPHATAVLPALPRDDTLPRDAIREAKLESLASAFEAFQHRARPRTRQRLGVFLDANRDWLDDYALYRALREERGFSSWESWPSELRDRDAAALSQAAVRLAGRIEFLRYVQWIAAEQWARVREYAAAHAVWLKGDLPFVIARDSSDVWVRRDEFELDSSVGAPPDAFSAAGQTWGLPMYAWERVRANDFDWWRRRVYHARGLFDILRIDHIVGFFRTYRIPLDRSQPPDFVPPDETSQQAQGESFLSAVLEASGEALLVAEDLGSVPDWVRGTLSRLGACRSNGARGCGYEPG
jgi:4-alpha-glucanotransferase